MSFSRSCFPLISYQVLFDMTGVFLSLACVSLYLGAIELPFFPPIWLTDIRPFHLWTPSGEKGVYSARPQSPPRFSAFRVDPPCFFCRDSPLSSRTPFFFPHNFQGPLWDFMSTSMNSLLGSRWGFGAQFLNSLLPRYVNFSVPFPRGDLFL